MKRPVLMALGLGFLWATTAVADPNGQWGGGMMWGGGYGMFGGLMMLVFWGVVIAGIVFLVLWLRGDRPAGKSTDAQEMLRQRFAKGEIDEDEFKRRKAVLEE